MAIILTNTILMPTSGSSVSSNQLPTATIASDIKKFNTDFEPANALKTNQFKVYIKSGKKSVIAGFCQSISQLRVGRDSESIRSGGNSEYEIKLPGPLKYSNVQMVHLITDNEVFLNWMVNGVNQGAAQTIDIEIRVGDSTQYEVYTLRDAIPVSWDFGTMAINMSGLVTNSATITYSIKSGEIPIENLTIAYGKMEYSTVTGPI